MKKVLFAAVAVFAFGMANAQDETKSFGFNQSDIFLEGNLGFSSTNDKNTEEKTSELNFNPKVGYFISDKLALGVELMAGSYKEEVAGSDVYKESNFGAGVFARYYFLDLGERFKTYAEAGLGFNSGKEEYFPGDAKYSGFGLGAGLGMQYFVTPKMAINFGLTDILSYSSNKFDGGENVSEFNGNVNVFNNFFATAQFGMTFKL
ncbi:outer membrane beta-barrel protein [uncultured Flavobacterium sp.]|uniref:outer membrane beta-barrel protein n=1 Tax=uncultured Flavobacterium sp. TaxID=165435 RepID=UPI0030C8BC45